MERCLCQRSPLWWEGSSSCERFAASAFPWPKAAPLLAAQSIDAAAALDSLAATASSSLLSTHHPMSSTKDSPPIPGTALSTSSKVPDRYAMERIVVAGILGGCRCLLGSLPPLLHQEQLPVHLIRPDSISSTSIRLPKCALLALLNADLTSMNRAPATFFSPRACWVWFIRNATPATQELYLPPWKPLPFLRSRWSAIRWAAVRSTG